VSITIPQMLSYQGKLTDTLGQPAADTTYSVRLRLYTVPSGGSPFWSETQSVTTKGGLFSVLLGSVTPIGSMPAAGTVYLGMAVSGGAELTPRVRIVSAAYAYKADTANFALAAAGSDNAWVRGGDSVLYTVHDLGLARGGAANKLWGDSAYTHVNFGVACTTGESGQAYKYVTVGGGYRNTASGIWATVTGGCENTASSQDAAVGGGTQNIASGNNATVAGGMWNRATGNGSSIVGGEENTASGFCSAVGGGYYDTAKAYYGGVFSGRSNLAGDAAGDSGAVVAGGGYNRAAGIWSFVGGGYGNSASADDATVAGGSLDTASNFFATVSGGYKNTASGDAAAVCGGSRNVASNSYATVAGGYGDTASATSAFAVNSQSVAAYSNSAAFNGQATTASNQTRVGILSKASGTFTIDHPLDPQGKILNHYFIEGPEMRNIYDGEAVLDASGRAVVTLPEYFEALNRAPRIQLTGVGSSDVYVAQEEADNRFLVGGRPGTKVYWQVTGERKDVSAEATRRMMPVEQPKTGALAGRMLDDDFLAGCMDQLVSEGKTHGIDFRTAAGRAKYEKMKQLLRELPKH
jgi:hypothetical protein